MQVLRPDQTRVLSAIRRRFRGGRRRVIAQVPTGGGKTTIAAHAIERAQGRGRCCWFLVHRKELLDQAMRRLEGQGLKPSTHDVVDTVFDDDLVRVLSIDTLISRGLDSFSRPPELIVLDECHHVAAEGWNKLLAEAHERWEPFILGLSATPYRADGNGLGCGFDEVVVGSSPRELVELGILVEPEIWSVDKDEGLVGDVAEEWVRRGQPAPALCFGVNREHSRQLQAAFEARGAVARHVDGSMPMRVRDDLVGRLGVDIEVICNVGVLTEGFDLPSLRCVILARATKSESLYVQMVGRGARSAPGKKAWTLLDHGANVLRFGHPMAHRPADLSGRKNKALTDDPKEGAVWLCPAPCLSLNQQSDKACRVCGQEPRVPLPRSKMGRVLKRVVPTDPASVAAMRQEYDRLYGKIKPRSRALWWRLAFLFKSRFGRHPHEVNGLMSDAEKGRFWREAGGRRR